MLNGACVNSDSTGCFLEGLRVKGFESFRNPLIFECPITAIICHLSAPLSPVLCQNFQNRALASSYTSARTAPLSRHGPLTGLGTYVEKHTNSRSKASRKAKSFGCRVHALVEFGIWGLGLTS